MCVNFIEVLFTEGKIHTHVKCVSHEFCLVHEVFKYHSSHDVELLYHPQ